jgi:hypothetical protein
MDSRKTHISFQLSTNSPLPDTQIISDVASYTHSDLNTAKILFENVNLNKGGITAIVKGNGP